jgi:hypothetical protein
MKKKNKKKNQQEEKKTNEEKEKKTCISLVNPSTQVNPSNLRFTS